MTTQIVLFPSSLQALESSDRLQSLRASYLFSGFDRTLCVFLRYEHGETIERVVDERFTYLEIGLQRNPRIGRLGAMLGAVQALEQVLARGRHLCVDAVIAYDPHLLGLVGWALACLLNAPLVVRLICHYGLKYAHTGQLSFAPFGSRRIERQVERWIYRNARAVLAACPNHEEYIRSVSGSDTCVLPYVTAQSAIFYQDVAPDLTLRETLAPGARKLVVSVGRLQSEKYPEDLIGCARVLDDPEITLLIVGDGNMRAVLEAQARSLRTRVIFAGVQPQDRVRSLFATADAVIVLQGGGAITEAALCAAPIVTYDFEMNPFVVRPGFQEGELVPFRDTGKLAAAVRNIVEDPTRARHLGRTVRAAARVRFGEEAARRAEKSIAMQLLRATAAIPSRADCWQLGFRPIMEEE